MEAVLLLLALLATAFTSGGAALGQSEAVGTTYSQLQCAGAEDHSFVGAYQHRSCLLRDVCYDSAAGTLLYYTDGSPIFVDNGFHFDFSAPLVQLEPRYPQATAVRSTLMPMAVFGPVPEGAVYSDAPLTFLLNLLYPENVGHFLFDGLFAAYRGLQLFGRAVAAPRDLQLLFASSCAETCRRAYGTNIIDEASGRNWCDIEGNCQRFKETLLPKLSRRPYLERGTGELQRNPLLCFKELITGTGLFPMMVSQDVIGMRLFLELILTQAVPGWQQLRARHVEGTQSGKPLKMVVFIKRGRRAPIGLEEAAAVVSSRMPNLQVSLVNPANLTFEQQLQEVLEADILVSPCGGISMTGVFLRPGSSVITIDYFDTKNERNWPMDGNIWGQLGGVHQLHYFFRKEEVQVSPAKDASFDDYRNRGRVVVDADRLAYIVEQAVKWVLRDAGHMAAAHYPPSRRRQRIRSQLRAASR